MKELEEIKTIKDIENLNLSKPYNWVYLNYDKKEGVKLFKEMDNKEINSLSDKELKIRIGKIKGAEREIVQYIGFIGGEK